jgi:hypothetical protein
VFGRGSGGLLVAISGLSASLKGHESVNAEFLESTDHPVSTALRRARKVNKIRTTFVASV